MCKTIHVQLQLIILNLFRCKFIPQEDKYNQCWKNHQLRRYVEKGDVECPQITRSPEIFHLNFPTQLDQVWKVFFPCVHLDDSHHWNNFVNNLNSKIRLFCRLFSKPRETASNLFWKWFCNFDFYVKLNLVILILVHENEDIRWRGIRKITTANPITDAIPTSL